MSAKLLIFLLLSVVLLQAKLSNSAACSVCEQKTALRRARGEAEPQCQFQTDGFEPQTSERPYTLNIKAVSKGQLEVNLRGVGGDSQFTDFLIYFHGRDGESMTGGFTVPRHAQTKARGLECNAAGRLAAPQRAVIPILRNTGKRSLTLTWRPDPGFVGHVKAHVYAAKDDKTFWTWHSDEFEIARDADGANSVIMVGGQEVPLSSSAAAAASNKGFLFICWPSFVLILFGLYTPSSLQ